MVSKRKKVDASVLNAATTRKRTKEIVAISSNQRFILLAVK
jgi:hypothetical protein